MGKWLLIGAIGVLIGYCATIWLFVNEYNMPATLLLIVLVAPLSTSLAYVMGRNSNEMSGEARYWEQIKEFKNG